MRFWPALASLILVLSLGSHPSLASDNPLPPDGGWRVGPETCGGTARAADDLAALLATPASIATAIPRGAPVNASTEIAIDSAIQAVLACFNAGDSPRAAALMTDAGVRRLHARLVGDEAGWGTVGGQIPVLIGRRWDDAAIALLAVRDLSRLPDSRVVAVVEVDDPLRPPPGPEVWTMIFADQAGRWLLDDLVPGEAPP